MSVDPCIVLASLPINESVPKFFKISFKIARLAVPLIGLNNIGATCYMNSTLQCLSQTLPLTQFFLGQNNQKYLLNHC